MKTTRPHSVKILLLLALPLLFIAQGLEAAPSDYDSITGEPKCAECHKPDMKNSIDYTRSRAGDGCINCHSTDYSEKFLAIDERFKDVDETEEVNSYVTVAEADRTATVGGPSGEPENMVLVGGGEFTMGQDDWWPKSQPAHKRDLKGFYIDKYEVTNAKYKAFVDATGHPKPPHWTKGIPKKYLDHPVIYVNWFDAVEYCKWEGKRLPSEAEWEKAARGTDGRAFPWGDKFSKDKANTPQYGNEDTLPVGSFADGVSPYGAHDMAGNVFEWTDSWYRAYPGNTHEDENFGERYKALRGGSWYDCTYYKCGISAPTYNRISFNPAMRSIHFGFRCAKDE